MAHAGTTSILRYEINTSGLQSLAQIVGRPLTNLPFIRFEIRDGRSRNLAFSSKVFAAPIEEGSRGATLSGRNWPFIQNHTFKLEILLISDYI
nr:hypothetical protein [Methylobacterium durans]